MDYSRELLGLPSPGQERLELMRLGPARLLGAIPADAGRCFFSPGPLAISRKLVEVRQDCRPAIAAAAVAIFALNPAVGLAAGWLIEAARRLLSPAPRPANGL